LEALLAAIIRIEPQIITRIFDNNKDGTVIVKLYDQDGSDTSQTVEKKTWLQNQQQNNFHPV
jgi:hypothetical protein